MDQAAAFDVLLNDPGVVFLLGDIDTGKTTFGLELARLAAARNISTVFVDADIGQSTVGPPTTIGLRTVTKKTQMEREVLRTADALSFVGAVTPKGHFMPLVTGTAKLVARARAAGAKMVVIDTTGYVHGLQAQGLKFYKLDLIRPDHMVAFERGGELEPLKGIARRFTQAKVITLDVGDEVLPRSPDERMTYREEQFAAYFAGGASRWRVKPTVFMPTLPPEFDLAQLDGLVVGMENGDGVSSGIGILEYDTSDETLRMVTPISEGVTGLRLGSVRIDISGRSRGPVDLRQLFGTE